MTYRSKKNPNNERRSYEDCYNSIKASGLCLIAASYINYEDWIKPRLQAIRAGNPNNPLARGRAGAGAREAIVMSYEDCYNSIKASGLCLIATPCINYEDWIKPRLQAIRADNYLHPNNQLCMIAAILLLFAAAKVGNSNNERQNKHDYHDIAAIGRSKG